MALITLHLFNSFEKAEEVIINTDHIVSIHPANEESTNIQLTAGNPFRAVESVAQIRDMFVFPGAAPLSAPETKSKKAAPAE